MLLSSATATPSSSSAFYPQGDRQAARTQAVDRGGIGVGGDQSNSTTSFQREINLLRELSAETISSKDAEQQEAVQKTLQTRVWRLRRKLTRLRNKAELNEATKAGRKLRSPNGGLYTLKSTEGANLEGDEVIQALEKHSRGIRGPTLARRIVIEGKLEELRRRASEWNTEGHLVDPFDLFCAMESTKIGKAPGRDAVLPVFLHMAPMAWVRRAANALNHRARELFRGNRQPVDSAWEVYGGVYIPRRPRPTRAEDFREILLLPVLQKLRQGASEEPPQLTSSPLGRGSLLQRGGQGG